MDAQSLKILKVINLKREVTLGEIYKICGRKFKDHRDLYPFVSLITGGFIDSVMTHDNRCIKEANNRELAISLYTATFGKGQFLYNGLPLVNDGDFNDQVFFCTAKTDLYLDDQEQKRRDRIYSLWIGIIVGITVALFSSYLGLGKR